MGDNVVQEKITDAMMSAFETVKKNKDKEYAKNNIIQSPEKIDAIISKCGNKNAIISGGSGLIPGPWGMAAAIPEITMIINNQIGMIYDIGKAYGKDSEQLSKELLVGIFASASGSAGIGLVTVHAGKLLVKRTSLRVLQKIIAMLGGKVTQKLLKSMVSKWIPGVGAAAMATWSKVSTNIIGNKAKELLSKEIVMEGTISENDTIEGEVTELTTTNEEQVIKNKIILLSNLMKIDGKNTEKEIKHISTIIESVNISDELTFELLEMLQTDVKGKVDFSLLQQNDESLSILIDMVSLAKVDDEFHNFERVYIKQAGKSLGFSDDEIEEVISA